MIGSKVWLLAAVAAAGLASGAVSAQGNLKVGVVSVTRLVEQSPQFAAAQKKIEDEFGPRQRDLQAMQQKLKTQTEQFQRDSPVMSEEERNNLERQIRDGQRDLQRTNDFLFKDADPLGYRCPVGAHIRRMNPRDTGENMQRRKMIRRD